MIIKRRFNYSHSMDKLVDLQSFFYYIYKKYLCLFCFVVVVFIQLSVYTIPVRIVKMECTVRLWSFSVPVLKFHEFKVYVLR